MVNYGTVSLSHIAMITRLKDGLHIKTNPVETAMLSIDRAKFVEINPYMDASQLLGWGSVISAPHVHALQLEYLSPWLVPGAQVLDIGSGTGYLTAAMATMVRGRGGRVTGIEHVEQLVDQSRSIISTYYPDLLNDGTVDIQCRDGRFPWRHPGYDVINVGAASIGVPRSLRDMLKRGGRMLIAIERNGDPSIQHLYCLDKLMDDKVSAKRITTVNFPQLCDISRQ